MPKVVLGHQAEGIETVALIPDSYTLDQQVVNICDNDGVWRAHSTGGNPAWVESDSKELAQAVADNYGCRIGRPE